MIFGLVVKWIIWCSNHQVCTGGSMTEGRRSLARWLSTDFCHFWHFCQIGTVPHFSPAMWGTFSTLHALLFLLLNFFDGVSLCSPGSSIPNLGCHFHFRIWEWPWQWPWPWLHKCTLHMTEKRFQNSDVREVLHSCNVFVIWQHHNWVGRILQINHHPIITLFKGWLLKVRY